MESANQTLTAHLGHAALTTDFVAMGLNTVTTLRQHLQAHPRTQQLKPQGLLALVKTIQTVQPIHAAQCGAFAE